MEAYSADCPELFLCVHRHRRSGAGGGRRSLRRGVDLRAGEGTRRRGAPRRGSRSRGSSGGGRSQGGGSSSNCRSRGSDSSGPITPVRRSRFVTLVICVPSARLPSLAPCATSRPSTPNCDCCWRFATWPVRQKVARQIRRGSMRCWTSGRQPRPEKT